MNLDVSLNKIKYQPLPFSHAALRCIEFKRMCEQLQHLDLNTLSTRYPQRLNTQKLSQKYIYPHPFNSHIQFCKPIKEGWWGWRQLYVLDGGTYMLVWSTAYTGGGWSLAMLGGAGTVGSAR
jgi:hypothetical protein